MELRNWQRPTGLTSNSQFLSSIISITLGNNNIGDNGAKELAKANWPNLQTLGLGIKLIILDENKIGDNGAKELAKANWPNLQ